MKRLSISNHVIITIIVALSLTACKKENVPVITTTAVSNITAITATSGGNITSEGSSTVISRGVCWSTGTTPTIADSKTTDGAGAGSFTSNIAGLNGGAVYYVRAYATNSVGTGYGMAMSFTTLGQSPTPLAATATNINVTSATLNGSVNANYLSTAVSFEYGTTTSYGSTVTATQTPLTGNTNTHVSADVTGLTAGIIYHYRVKAVNSLGTTNSNDITFTTLGQVPIASTKAATNIQLTTAILNGTVNANYLSTTVNFDYGTTINYGSTVTAIQSPVSGSTNTNVNATISDLTIGTTYHFRIKTVNSLGTTAGDDMTFTTLSKLIDIEGNIYNILSIGTQVWMAENLKTAKYNNGDLIGTTAPVTLDISGEINPKYQWAYNGDENNVAVYGRLYTWYAVTDSRNVCPTDWHEPTDAEWTTLTDYLGGLNIAGGKMKEAGTGHWASPNTGATNESGFKGLPGGQRSSNGTFSIMGNNAIWWSTTAGSSPGAYRRFLTYDGAFISRSYSYQDVGFSVRCIKD